MFFRKLLQSFARACKNGFKGFIEWIRSLLKTEGKHLDEVLDEVEEVVEDAGMAENIYTGIKMSLKEFEEGFKKISKLEPEEAIKYWEEAVKYFNHHVIDERIVQISDINCVNVVERFEEFLKTGKIKKAEPSDYQDISKLSTIYGGSFLTMSIPSIKNVMKEGERGIIFCSRPFPRKGHVINVMKKNNELIFIDTQVFSGKANLNQGYESFKYLKTN